MSRGDGTVIIEGARIIFRNFAGKETMYNSEGDRNFCVLLEPDAARAMAQDGWNVKTLKPRDGSDEEPQPYIQVSVGYRHRPPRVVMVTSKGRTDLTEAELEVLDWVDIANVDLIIRPYTWNVGGRGGIKAYLKSFFVTIEEDYLELKYSDVPDLNELPARAGKVQELTSGPERVVLDGEWRDQ